MVKNAKIKATQLNQIQQQNLNTKTAEIKNKIPNSRNFVNTRESKSLATKVFMKV